MAMRRYRLVIDLSGTVTPCRCEGCGKTVGDLVSGELSTYVELPDEEQLPAGHGYELRIHGCEVGDGGGDVKAMWGGPRRPRPRPQIQVEGKSAEEVLQELDRFFARGRQPGPREVDRG